MALSRLQEKQIKLLCSRIPGLALLYLFGSRAQGKAGKNSDYDFAAFFHPRVEGSFTDRRLKLAGGLMRILKDDRVDVVLLNRNINCFLKSNVVQQGKLLFSRFGIEDSFESSVMHERHDFEILERQYFG